MLNFFKTSEGPIEKLDRPRPWFIASALLLVAVLACLYFAPFLSFLLFLIFCFCLGYGFLMLGRHQMADHFILLGQCLDNSPQGVLITTPEGKSLWCNRAFRHLLPGVVPLDVTKGHILEGLNLWLANPEDIEAVYRMLQLASTGFEDRMTIMVRSPDGRAESYYLFVSPVDGQEALLWQVTSHKQDAGALNAALHDAREAALHEWQQEATQNAHPSLEEDIIDNMPCGWFAMDTEGVVQSANTAFLKILGLRKEQILKGDFHLSDHILFGEMMKYSHVMALLQDKESQEMNGVIHIRRIENGQTIKAWLYQSPKYNAKGKLEGTNSVIIPEPEYIEEILQKKQAALQTSMQSPTLAQTSSPVIRPHIPVNFSDIPLAMVWVDERRNIKKVSHRFLELMNRNEIELVGAPFEHLFLANDADRVQKFLYRVSAGAKSLTLEGLKGMSGSDSLLLRLYAIKADTDNPNEILLVAEDVSETVSLRSKMDEAEKDRTIGQVAGKVIHDFKNNLYAITAGAESVMERLQPEDSIYPDMHTILTSAQKAAHLSKWLNRMNRANTGDKKWHNANELLLDSQAAIRAALGAKNELNIRYSNEIAGIHIDTIALDQALLNLVSNARDAMPTGGKVSITVEKRVCNQPQQLFPDNITAGVWVVIQVADSGTGIEEHILKRIFEKRFTTKKAGEGTGIGLDSVRQTIRSQDGYVTVRSIPNKGSIFEIWLPFAAGENISSQPKKQYIPVDLSGEGKILVVEDEALARGFTVRALKQRGYEVTEAFDGHEGLELIMKAEGQFDLIISDISMPRMDGPSMIAHSRQKYPHIPVLIVSGNSGEDLDRDLSKIGGGNIPFLAKPYTLEGLTLKVKSILTAKQKSKAKRLSNEPLGDLFSPFTQSQTKVAEQAPTPPQAAVGFAQEVLARQKAIQQSETPAQQQPAAPQKPVKSKPVILLVDDENMARQLTGKKLSSSGFEVFEATDGPEGLSIALEHLDVLDMVITDLNMMQMNGDEMAEEIWKKQPSMPIIFLSGDVGHLRDKIQNPHAYYIEKPAMPSKIAERVAEILSL